MKRAPIWDEAIGCFKVQLTQGYFALVDKEDVEAVCRFNWSISRAARRKKIYATTFDAEIKKNLYMHKFITGFKMTDHKNGNGLDNRRCNLRSVTKAQNEQAKGPTKGRKYKGVTPHKGGFVAQISHNGGVHIYIGYFKSEDEAAEAYNRKAVELFGEYAFQNKIGSAQEHAGDPEESRYMKVTNAERRFLIYALDGLPDGVPSTRRYRIRIAENLVSKGFLQRTELAGRRDAPIFKLTQDGILFSKEWKSKIISDQLNLKSGVVE